MSDAAHPADGRGPLKPKKPAPADAAGEVKKKPADKLTDKAADKPADKPADKAADKPEAAQSPKPKSPVKKPLKVRAPGAESDVAHAASSHADSRDGAEKSGDSVKSSRDEEAPSDHKTAAKSDPKAKSKPDSKHAASGAAAADDDDDDADRADSSGRRKAARARRDRDEDTPVPTDGDAADANIAAAEAEAADLPELPDLPDVAPDEDEKFHAMCAWLSAAALILAMVCPFYFAGPLLYFLRYRRRSRFVAFHAKQVLWWSLVATVIIWSVGLASGLVLGSIFGWQFAGLNLVALVPVQVTIIIYFSWIGLKALHGVKYQTPIVGRMAESAPQKWF